MFKKKRTYTNTLTERIKKNPNIPVEEVFSDELLSVTIRNEADDFLDYIFPKDELSKDNPKLPKLDLIIKYALENKEYHFDEDDSKNPFTFIISRNTASFLSSPGKKLNEFGSKDGKKRIFRALRKFITTEKAHDSMSAGNFTRIFLAWYGRNPEEFEDNEENKDFYKDNFSIDALISFCVSNIKELSYAELLERFLATEYEDDQQDALRSKVIYEILQKVRNIIGEKILNKELKDGLNSISRYRSESFNPKLKQQITKSQPLTCRYEQMPIPGYLDNQYDECRSLKANEKINTVDLIPITEKDIKLSIADKNLYAYTLINIIWTAANESSTIFEFIQEQQPEGDFAEKKRMLEYLLFIGVFGYENIMLSSAAFRILDIVVNGDEKMDIKPISKKNRRTNDGHDIINDYAEYVVFRADNLSNLAIFSFPIFYNCVYPELQAQDDGKIEYNMKNFGKKYLPKTNKKHRQYITNEKGLTPFVYLIPVAMTEPPVSAELCTSYFKIFDRLCKNRITLFENAEAGIDDVNELKETINTINKIDDFYLDFITYKFEYPGLEGRYNIFELTEKLFPLNPHYYTKENSKLQKLKLEKDKLSAIETNSGKARPLINHSFVRITELISSSESFLNSEKGSLFTTKDQDEKVLEIEPEIEPEKETKRKSKKETAKKKKKMEKKMENSLPKYKELNDHGQSVIFLNSGKYNEIIEESRQGKMNAGPRDGNQELNGL